MIGQTISHYKILEKLGEGGMGVVYKAQDLKLDRIVALKFLSSHLTASESDRKRFFHEAKAASSLDHPNICTFYELGETDQGQMFIAMAYYEGETVKQKIKDRPLPLYDAIDITISIAQGLSNAHEKGITHRDIKSENIMVTADGGVKIMDFGLASIVGASTVTKTGATVGTVPYMSPEQARGEKVDARTDIWSLAAVLYEMVTGQLPFASQYNEAIVYLILNQNPQPITALRSGVPMELERIINKCLEKKASDRYQHVDEMLVDLKRLKRETETGDALKPTGFVAVAGKKKVRWFALGISVIVLALIVLYIFLTSTPVSVERKSIAVLPFKNMSDSKEEEYFSDGITEDIITRVSNIGELKVISRTSVMQYKNSNKNLKDIGKELDVATVLEGSVRRAGTQVRIVAQLIDASSDEHLWAHTYDKELTQIFAVQSDVAGQIANALKAKLSPANKERVEKKPTENSEAYQLYLRGLFYWNKRGSDGLKKSVEYLQQAIDKDSAFALAYAGLANAYIAMPFWTPVSKEDNSKAIVDATLKALAIDPDLAEGHIALASIHNADWDWKGTEREYKHALELNPNYATAHQWYAEYLVAVARYGEAIPEIRKALELDPFSLAINSIACWVYNCAEQYDKVFEYARRIQDIDSTSARGHAPLVDAYRGKGEDEKAIVEFEQTLRLQHVPDSLIALEKHTYQAAGWKGIYKLNLRDNLDARSRGSRMSTLWIARSYARLGDRDKAMEWLETGYREHDEEFWQLKGLPELKSLHSDPRFIDLLRRMGLEE